MTTNVHSPSDQMTVKSTAYSGSHAVHASAAQPSPKASAPISSTRSGKTASKPIEISISDAGRQMAQAMTHVKVRTAVEASATLETVKTAVKENPEAAKNLHSNLRALRINHLLFD